MMLQLSFLLLSPLALFWLGGAQAQFNVSNVLASSLTAGHYSPWDNCNQPGLCIPANQTVPPYTLWYWCGFDSTYATSFNVNLTTNRNQSRNSTIQWMRKTELEECALPNLKGSGSCKVLPGSRCSKRDSCSSYLWALSFPDDICLVIANVNSSALIAQVQVFNYSNDARYYGTIFTIILLILGGGAVLAKVGYDFYINFTQPVNHGKHMHTKPKPPVPAAPEGTYTSMPGAPGVGVSVVSEGGWRSKLPAWAQRLLEPKAVVKEPAYAV